MVTLQQARESNSRISSTLPSGLVAVFLGGTSGIGEYALKQFAKSTVSPRVYFIGRSQDAADRITRECQALNPNGSFTFIQMDTSLLRNIDKVTDMIKDKEKAINLLFLTQGTLQIGVETSEGLPLVNALLFYGRTRFAMNLLPLVQNASGLRRVVSVAVGTKEARIDTNDIARKNVPLMKARGHGASLTTFSLEKLASLAPEVSFVHQFPGWVRGGVARDNKGPLWFVIKNVISPVLAPFLMLPDEQSGEWSLFAATSAIFPALVKGADGVPLASGVSAARGVTGNAGAGVYSVDYDASPASEDVEKLLAAMRAENVDKAVWDHIQGIFDKVLGSEKPGS